MSEYGYRQRPPFPAKLVRGADPAPRITAPVSAEGRLVTPKVKGLLDPEALDYRDVVMLDQPILYYRMDEEAGVTTMRPHVGYIAAEHKADVIPGVTGLLTGDDNLACEYPGPIGAGNTAHTEFADVDELEVTRISIEAWVKPHAGGGYLCRRHQVLQFSRGAAAGGDAFKPNFQVTVGGNNNNVTSTVTIANDRVSHVVGTWDGEKVRIYVNGLLAGTSGFAVAGDMATGTTNPLVVGSDSVNTANAYDGIMDELAIYDRALNAERILAHYQKGAGVRS